MDKSERMKLTITETKEPRAVGQAEVMDFLAKTGEDKPLKYGVWSKTLYQYIKKDSVIDCDVATKTSEKTDADGNPYINRKVTQIYIDGKPVGGDKQFGGFRGDSPEKIASIEKQNAFTGAVQLVCAGKASPKLAELVETYALKHLAAPTSTKESPVAKKVEPVKNEPEELFPEEPKSTKASKEEINTLMKLMGEKNFSMADLGKFANTTHKWGIKTATDLSSVQIGVVTRYLQEK